MYIGHPDNNKLVTNAQASFSAVSKVKYFSFSHRLTNRTIAETIFMYGSLKGTPIFITSYRPKKYPPEK